MEPISIIGAGPAGLSTGYYLNRDYSIWEKNEEVGGGCRTEKVDGFSFDYGGHIFYPKEEQVKTLINKLLKDNLSCLLREAWIYSKGIYSRYPFQANLYGHSVEVVKECLLGLMEAKLKYGEKPDNFTDFEDFIYKVFGKGIARHFMIPFNKKQWAVPLKEMTLDWMDKFVPIPTLEQVLDGSLKMAPRCIGINAQFIYPRRGGIQAIFDSFVPFLQNVHTSTEVNRISVKNKSFEINGKNTGRYEKLVSTIPLPELIAAVDSVPSEVRKASEKLRWTALYIVNIGIDRPEISDKHRVYYPEEDIIFHKLGYYQNQSPDMVPEGKSAVSAEVSFSENRKIDKENLVERTIQDLIKAKVLFPDDRIVLTHILTLPYAYAVYDRQRSQAVAVIKEFLEKNDIYLCGRYAQWEYQNMEQNILAGKKRAEKLKAELKF
ncbi:MAG: protoporphyrinogen/coproporphyrinogen oxidase [Acidobacteriota bacterium]